MITLILILCFSLLPAPSAFAENIYYGQIINSGTYLYKDTKNNLIFEEESFELLQDILEDSNALKHRVDYTNLVNTEFTRTAAK